MKKEIWKGVPDFEGKYEVSNFGNVRGFYCGGKKRKEPKNKKPQLNPNGYVYVVLQDGKKLKAWSVHRLVLTVFDKAMPRNIDCCHINHIRTDNRYSNLKWATRKQNEEDKYKSGRGVYGEKNGQSKMTTKMVLKIRGLFKTKMSTHAIAKLLGLKQQNVWNICNNKTWNHI